uniref:Cytochrome P450 n=1 Tax=Kalanchoe fedtschenkoi TaxID=63787 RepID=A0A7N0V283_KALFE
MMEGRVALALLPQWVSLPLIVLLLIPVLSFLLIIKRGSSSPTNKGRLNLPPSPTKLPILGHLHLLLLAGKNPHRALFKLSQKYGPAMLLQLGTAPTLVISNSDMAKEVLQTHDADFCSRPKSPGFQRLTYGYLDVAFSPHSHFRTEMRKLFSYEMLKMKREQSLWNARVSEMSQMIDNMTQQASVNLNDHVFKLVDGIVGQVAFGKNYGATQFKGRKFQAVMDECMNALGSFTAQDFFPNWAGRFMDFLTGYNAGLERVFRDFDGYFEMMIAEHLDPTRPALQIEDFVDVLLRLSREGEGEFKLSINHIKAVLMNTFIGAVDTTAVSVVWAMSELLLYPDVLKKATAEARSVAGKKSMVEESDLKQLKYISCVVKEIFRMHPAAPLLVPHEAINSTKIGKEGYDVLEKTRIIVNAWALGRDPACWTDPDKFNPERFEVSDVEFKGGHFQFIPFGSGRRICPGMVMGSTTITYTIANLLRCFDWELPEGVRREDVCMEEEGGLTMHKKTPLIIVPTRVYH